MPRVKTTVPVGLIIALLMTVEELVVAGTSVAQTTAYAVLELSAADAGQIPCRLNNLGDLVGRTGNPGVGQTGATLWSHGSLKPKHLGALPGGDYSSAFAINDVADITGASNTGSSIVPFIWKAKGGLKRVPLLPGDNCGQGFSINKYGHLAGYSSGPNGARAFLWTGSKGIRNLGSLPGSNSSRARAVNDSDEVVGTSASPVGNRAVLWTNTGQVRDLGTLPGDTSSEAIAINNAGDVVGYSKGPGGLRAFLWTNASGMQDLGALPGGKGSRALDINDSGYVVGSCTMSADDRAFIWTKQQGMSDLNNAASADLGVVFVEAHAINNKGQILVMGKATPEVNAGGGASLLGDHDDCAPAPPSTFLLTPIPAQ